MSNFKTVSLMQGNKFVDTYEAQESPRRPGDYIIPEGAIEGQPNIPPLEGHDRVLNEGVWEYEIIQAPEPEPQTELTLEQRRALMRVKRGQGRIALLEHGHLDAVEMYVNGSQCPPKIRIAYQDALEWERLSETTAAMMQILELTDEETDALFTYAAQVTY